MTQENKNPTRYIIKDTQVEPLLSDVAEANPKIGTTFPKAMDTAYRNARENLDNVRVEVEKFLNNPDGQPDIMSPEMLRMMARAEQARRDLVRLDNTCHACGDIEVDLVKVGFAKVPLGMADEEAVEKTKVETQPRCIPCARLHILDQIAEGLDTLMVGADFEGTREAFIKISAMAECGERILVEERNRERDES